MGPMVSRRAVVCAALASSVIPFAAHAASKNPLCRYTSLCDDNSGGRRPSSVERGEDFVTFRWILSRRSGNLEMSMTLQDFDYKEALHRTQGLSHCHTAEMYLRMVYHDPNRDGLLRRVAQKLVAGTPYGVNTFQNILSFVQGLPHCESREEQKWPTESLLTGGADCSDKTVLAAALLELSGLGVRRKSCSGTQPGTIPLWVMLRTSKHLHLTLGLNKRALFPERRHIKKLIDGDAAPRERCHMEVASPAYYVDYNGDRYLYTELNGGLRYLPGMSPTFLSKWNEKDVSQIDDWQIIAPA